MTPEGRGPGGGVEATGSGGRIDGNTRVLALLGDPVHHSLSPAMQNAAFAAAGLDGVYVALRCGSNDLPHLLRGLARSGGGGNVTVPHKENAAKAVEKATDAVRQTGACNTFWMEDGRVHGDNTDVEGLRRALRTLPGDLAGSRILLLGAGGAARAVLAVLVQGGAGSIHVLNRTPDRAHRLLSRLGNERTRVLESREALPEHRYDLVVNATSLGLRPDDPLPLELDQPQGVGAVLDLVYAPGETPFVHRAREREIPAADGAEMLLHQGAAAFERWWDRAAPIEAMRRALRAERATGPSSPG